MNRQAYEFLNSARVLHWQWMRLKAKHDELESCLMPSAIRYDRDKVQTSPEDPMSKIVVEINELETEMNKIRLKRAETIEEIDRVINFISSEEVRTALTMRYINRKPVRKIAETMGYSEKRVYQFMDQGGITIAKELEKIRHFRNGYQL